MASLISRLVALILAIIAFFTTNSVSFDSFVNNQLKTVEKVEVLDENIYMMNYDADYAFDEFLASGGASSTVELLAFAEERLTFNTVDLELGEGDFACTTFNTFTPEGDHLLGRNFDYKDAPCFVVWTHPEDGYASIGMVDCNFMLYGDINKPSFEQNRYQTLLAPYCCVDGINETGLSIGVLELKTDPVNQETDKTDITTTAMIRLILDKAATVEEAVALFKSYDMHDSFLCAYHFQIADANGKSVIIEYVDNEVVEIYPEGNSGLSACQWAANYYITPDVDDPEAFGFERTDIVKSRLTEKAGVLTQAEAMQLLNDVHLEYEHRLGYMVRTLWSAVYNATDATVDICAGLDYETIYRFDVEAPMVAEAVS